METTPNAQGKSKKCGGGGVGLRENFIESYRLQWRKVSTPATQPQNLDQSKRALLSSGQEALPVSVYGTKVLQNPPMDALSVLEAVPPKEIININTC